MIGGVAYRSYIHGEPSHRGEKGNPAYRYAMRYPYGRCAANAQRMRSECAANAPSARRSATAEPMGTRGSSQNAVLRVKNESAYRQLVVLPIESA